MSVLHTLSRPSPTLFHGSAPLAPAPVRREKSIKQKQNSKTVGGGFRRGFSSWRTAACVPPSTSGRPPGTCCCSSAWRWGGSRWGRTRPSCGAANRFPPGAGSAAASAWRGWGCGCAPWSTGRRSRRARRTQTPRPGSSRRPRGRWSWTGRARQKEGRKERERERERMRWCFNLITDGSLGCHSTEAKKQVN